MKLVFSADAGAIERLVDEIEHEVENAMQGAVKGAADEAVEEGRANIAGAGFSGRWQRAFTSKFYPNKGGDPAALIYHRIGLATVFERGITISGKPLLWLPIGHHQPLRQFRGRLVSVNIAGKPPMLFDKFDRARGPLFFGTPSAHIRKRFDLMRIIAAVAERMTEFYQKRIG